MGLHLSPQEDTFSKEDGQGGRSVELVPMTFEYALQRKQPETDLRSRKDDKVYDSDRTSKSNTDLVW